MTTRVDELSGSTSVFPALKRADDWSKLSATCDHDWIPGQTFDTYPAHEEITCRKCGKFQTREIGKQSLRDDGVTQVWQTGGNSLKLRNGPLHEEYRLYLEYKDAANNRILCTINQDGRVFQDGIDITDNDAAMAQCFVDYLKKFQKVEVKRG